MPKNGCNGRMEVSILVIGMQGNGCSGNMMLASRLSGCKEMDAGATWMLASWLPDVTGMQQDGCSGLMRTVEFPQRKCIISMNMNAFPQRGAKQRALCLHRCSCLQKCGVATAKTPFKVKQWRINPPSDVRRAGTTTTTNNNNNIKNTTTVAVDSTRAIEARLSPAAERAVKRPAHTPQTPSA